MTAAHLPHSCRGAARYQGQRRKLLKALQLPEMLLQEALQAVQLQPKLPSHKALQALAAEEEMHRCRLDLFGPRGQSGCSVA